ncbi:Integrator complex subunit 11 [Tieghemiomyces parasiticus]|uniref:Integrator complex subunit 11 n=1 Tax=Tieghemiomyces parasiticus TaxID=78921 RepID=A0A9W8A8M8_9FUNG|nr:Integrator complex subunit 11 [Tieghemiomyces parasiticus]
MRILPLGAGQDVGRSCLLVTLGGKNIMFDCGMHMGFNDERRFPDFSYISKDGRYTEALDCIIISHFHLDHCGALPFFTEMCGYDGPIYMTHPTKAICPILLEDYRKITVERKGETNFFTSQNLKDCMKKVVTVNLHETHWQDDEIEIKAYYAGHVLGAAMFYVRVGTESIVYTGDYNMTPDRHLGSAWIDKCRPDVLVTESTYATTIRDSKRSRERDFLSKVYDCVTQGGKVIIPVFALGRAQELCILIETFWDRMGLKVPVYFSAGLTEKANNYYKLFINWTNQKIKDAYVHRNMFDFKHIKPWDRAYLDQPGPMVLFATPGMLHIGTSLEVFKKWAHERQNMIIMPGYCVAGTVGAKVLAGQKVIDIDNFTTVHVNLQVKNLSFSAHADAKGIMQLIRQCEPRNVVLVHGEKTKMGYLKSQVMKEFSIPCFDPANGESIDIETSRAIPVHLDAAFHRRLWEREQQAAGTPGENPTAALGGPATPHFPATTAAADPPVLKPLVDLTVDGLLVVDESGTEPPRLLDPKALPEDQAQIRPHALEFETRKRFGPESVLAKWTRRPPVAVPPSAGAGTSTTSTETESDSTRYRQSATDQVLQVIHNFLRENVQPARVLLNPANHTVVIETMAIQVEMPDEPNTVDLVMTWNYEDEDLASQVLASINRLA